MDEMVRYYQDYRSALAELLVPAPVGYSWFIELESSHLVRDGGMVREPTSKNSIERLEDGFS